MQKSSVILGLAISAIAATDASAQSKTPDALYYQDHRDLYKQFESVPGVKDSLVRKFKQFTADSVKVNADGSIIGYGSVPNGIFPNGILLDNRSESDGYLFNGTRYYIRNMKPSIEPKEVTPGSNIYRLK